MIAHVVAGWVLLCFRTVVAVEDAEPRQPAAYSEAINNGTYGSYPIRTYATEGVLSSPRLNWVQWNPECDDGRLHFITPRGDSLSNPGPMILDNNGDLIWSHYFDNEFGGQAYDLKVQHYQGESYLTFWLGNDAVRGHGAGVYYMLNSSYDIVHQVNAAGGFEADLHEFLITPQGTALVTVYDKHYIDLTPFRAFNPDEDPDDKSPNWIWDCLIQEISIDTGNLLFQWRVSDHINLTETYRFIEDEGTDEVPWDWFHINSVAKDELGNYLISARYTHSLTYIDGKTGNILWNLGGKQNDFMDLNGDTSLRFAWQHDARFHPPNAFPEVYHPPRTKKGVTKRLLTMFDNGIEQEDGSEISRGLLMEVTYPTPGEGSGQSLKPSRLAIEEAIAHITDKDISIVNGTDPKYTVRLIKSYENPAKLRSVSQGSMQLLPGEHAKVLVGYGYNAVWTEFDINGNVLCDVRYGAESSWDTGDIQSYRAYKYAWTGRPKTCPKIDLSDDELEAYVSWNGATEVVEWVLQASEFDEIGDGDHWSDIYRTVRTGFETTLQLPDVAIASRRYLRALAIGKDGKVLSHGISELFDRDEIPPSEFATIVDDDLASQLVSADPVKRLAMVIIAVAAMVFGYDLFRRWRSWRVGRPGAGPFRLKQAMVYSRVSGEV